MAAQLEPFQDSISARAELVPFLTEQFQGEGACSDGQWMRRMAYWWDDNPFAQAHPCRGWVLRDTGRVVGYLGVIPTLYEDAEGKPVPALIATTWAVVEEHRNAALPMGMMLHRQGRNALLVDTTPSPEVQQLLQRWGWQSRPQIRRSLVLRGVLGRWLARLMDATLPDLPAKCQLVTDVSLIQKIHLARPGKSVQKHITPEYLRWYAASPMREHYFVGVVDAEGALTSYVMLTPKPIKGIPTWKVMDWFTTLETSAELAAIIGSIAKHCPVGRGRFWPLISVASFLPDDPWQAVPEIYTRNERVSHHYWLPQAMDGQVIRPVMAEGDWGL